MTFLAPLFITLLIRYVSGVPLLERKQMKKPEFVEYAKRINPMIPWFPREVKDAYQRIPAEEKKDE